MALYFLVLCLVLWWISWYFITSVLVKFVAKTLHKGLSDLKIKTELILKNVLKSFFILFYEIKFKACLFAQLGMTKSV